MSKYKRRTTVPKECNSCGKLYSKPPKETHEYWLKRKYCSHACMAKNMLGKRNEQTNHWSGDRISYSGLHQWIHRTYGKATYCEGIDDIDCKDIGGYEWAELHHKGYARDRDNFRMLCKSCHRTYDHPKYRNSSPIKQIN